MGEGRETSFRCEKGAKIVKGKRFCMVFLWLPGPIKAYSPELMVSEVPWRSKLGSHELTPRSTVGQRSLRRTQARGASSSAERSEGVVQEEQDRMVGKMEAHGMAAVGWRARRYSLACTPWPLALVSAATTGS